MPHPDILEMSNGAPMLRLVASAEEYLGEAWPELIPFGSEPLPPFPVSALPDWLARYVSAEAVATATPPDLAAMIGLSCLAVALAGKVRAEIREGWAEPVNLFTITALPPGNRKSAVFTDMTAPILAYERAEAERMRDTVAEAATNYEILKRRAEAARNDAAREKDGDTRAALKAEAIELAQEIERTRVPALPRLIADDVTPEALASLIAEHGRMAVMSAEGGIFETLAGRYTNGVPNFDVFLKGHAGDPLRIDRKGRPPEFVRSPALTLGMAIQPDVLRGLTGKPGFRGRGLLGRFLYAVPVSPLGSRDVDPPSVSDGVKSRYFACMMRLLELPFAEEDGEPAAYPLRFSGEARRHMVEFSRWLEPRLGEDGDLGHMADWGGKLAGAVARMAALFHCADRAGNVTPWREDVQAASVDAAIHVAEYLIPHARAAYGEMGQDETADAAQRIIRWLERAQAETFTKRELFEGVKGSFRRVEALEEPLATLAAHGYIRQRQAAEKRRGRPSDVYDVHPQAFTPSRNSQHTDHAGNIANIANYCEDGEPDQDARQEAPDRNIANIANIANTSASDGAPEGGDWEEFDL